MEIHFEKWFKEILALQEKFNKSKDPVEKFAVLTALVSAFEKHLKWMGEEAERFKVFAVDTLLGRKA